MSRLSLTDFPPKFQFPSSMWPTTPRRIVTRSGKRSRGCFPSRKSEDAVKYESQLELSAYRILEASTIVKRFTSQPAKLKLELDGDQSLKYTPDFSARVEYGETVVGEVKPDCKFLKPKMLDRMFNVHQAFAEQGMLFVILLESDLLFDAYWKEKVELALREMSWACSTVSTSHESTLDFVRQDLHNIEDSSYGQIRERCDSILSKAMHRSFEETVSQATSWLNAWRN